MSQRPKTRRTDDFRAIYGQAFLLGFTPHEFSFELGVMDIDDNVREINTQVIMSPQKFREFLDKCEEMWGAYEKKFGILDKKKKPREK